MTPKKAHSKTNDQFFSPRLTRSKLKATTVSSKIIYQHGDISSASTTTTTTTATSNNSISSTIKVTNDEATISMSVLGDDSDDDDEIDELTDQINDLTVYYGSDKIHEIDKEKFNITYDVLESLSANTPVCIFIII